MSNQPQNDPLVGTYNLDIPQGADTNIAVTYKVSNAVVDLSLHSAKLQVRDNEYGDTVYLELTSDDGEIILSDVAPNIIITFPSAKTELMTKFNGMRYDIELYSPSNTVTRPLKGTFKLDREVTK
jgi:hypothetical protein